MLVSIVIIKLIIKLISWYYSCSAYDCVSKLKICSMHNLVNLKIC